jgi:hypothetical protein
MHLVGGADHPAWTRLRAASERLAALTDSGVHVDIEGLADTAAERKELLSSTRKQLGTARGRLTRFEKKNGGRLRDLERAPEREAARARKSEQALRGFEQSGERVKRARDHLVRSQAEVVRLTHELEQMGAPVKGPVPRTTRRRSSLCSTPVVIANAILEARADCRLAMVAARFVTGPEGWLLRLRGYALAHWANVLRVRGQLPEAEARLEEGYTRLNPLVASGHLKLAENIPDKAFTPEMHAILTKIEESTHDPLGWEASMGALRKVMNTWKLGVTALNPGGYRIRNTLSDVWNAYLSGVPLRAMPLYLGKANKLMLAARRGDQRAVLELMKMELHGVTQGLFAGDVGRAMRAMRGRKGQRSYGALRLPRFYVRMMTGANRWGENVGRIAHMMYRTEHGGHSYADAAWEVRRAHFDYADLTPFEQKLKDMMVPFYTWTRKNVPYQIVQIFSRPGRASTFFKAAQESELAAGNTKGEIVPDFLRQGGAFKVPFLGDHTYILPQIGIMDIARATSERGLLGMLGPQYQALAARMTGVNPFSGSPINPPGHRFVPANPLISSLVGAIAPGLAGETERTVGSRQVRSAGINPWLQYLALETGAPGLRYLLGRNPISEAENPAENRFLNQFAGLPLYTANQDEERMLAELKDADAFKRYSRVLRDENLVPEAKRRKRSAAEKAILQMVYAGQGRP